MLYDDLATLINTHCKEIALASAQIILSLNLNCYKGWQTDQLMPGFVVGLEFLCNYLRTNDLEPYREFIRATTAEQHRRGFTMEEITLTGNTVAGKIVELIEREYAGPENEPTRLRFERRLNSLITFGQVAAVNTRPTTKLVSGPGVPGSAG